MLNSLTYLAATKYYVTTSDDAAVGAAVMGVLGAFLIPFFILYVLEIIAMWKIFTKAGREGWKSIIPIYNMYVLTEISGQNGIMILLCLIPGVGALIWNIMVSLKLAPAFGKDTGFAIGLILLGPIFQMILGFGDAQYRLGGAASAAPSAGAAAPQKPEDPWVSGKQQ